MPPVQPGDVRSSRLSRGRCHVYVFPCAYEDILKLGFSRDPIGRLQSLHRRYFEFFDLDRAFLVETETVRDARKVELAWRRDLPLHNAPSPLVIRRPAAGHTEWYRGAYEALRQSAARLHDAGYTLHDPAKRWLRENLIARGDSLYAWSNAMLEELQGLPDGHSQRLALRQTLLDALDAYPALDIPLEPLVPLRVWAWYGRGTGSGY